MMKTTKLLILHFINTIIFISSITLLLLIMEYLLVEAGVTKYSKELFTLSGLSLLFIISLMLFHQRFIHSNTININKLLIILVSFIIHIPLSKLNINFNIINVLTLLLVIISIGIDKLIPKIWHSMLNDNIKENVIENLIKHEYRDKLKISKHIKQRTLIPVHLHTAVIKYSYSSFLDPLTFDYDWIDDREVEQLTTKYTELNNNLEQQNK